MKITPFTQDYEIFNEYAKELGIEKRIGENGVKEDELVEEIVSKIESLDELYDLSVKVFGSEDKINFRIDDYLVHKFLNRKEKEEKTKEKDELLSEIENINKDLAKLLKKYFWNKKIYGRKEKSIYLNNKKIILNDKEVKLIEKLKEMVK